ncbi:hypothetical protein HALLA_13595 [Halostagnicola larsenii XH-48]|uniref:Uncharacterized protein n=1 Tax=Halostagnicola larsenii XH-48 TaxID=797299 RepID=W0JUU0_9EURY|nr:hypothetical protein HALLA_13595 [Halostagnicola larsenii XH-48]
MVTLVFVAEMAEIHADTRLELSGRLECAHTRASIAPDIFLETTSVR